MSEAYQEIFQPKPDYNLRTRSVPWAFKLWPNFTDQDKEGLRAHFTTFNDEQKLIAYKKYLRDWCRVPSDWLEILPNT